MSYSSLLTSSSVDLFDRTSPKETIQEKAAKWFPYFWKALVTAILFALLFLVCYDIHRRQIQNGVTKGNYTLNSTKNLNTDFIEII